MLGLSRYTRPTVQIPSWTDQTAYLYSPCNSTNSSFQPDPDYESDSDLLELYSSDHFRMYEFKVQKCNRPRSHDWTECPFAHPGEKARRRDPRKYHYSGTACPDFRKGSCKKGDSCDLAHGVFECWLHPSRYRTQPCKDGLACKRRVCFFAHSADELRVLSPSQKSPGCESDELVKCMRSLQLSKVKSLPSSWNVNSVSVGGSPVFGSPARIRPGFCSLPSTPTQTRGCGVGYIGSVCEEEEEEEPVMERVESGRDLRMKMFERLSKEGFLGRVNPDPNCGGGGPDVGWVSELVK